LPRGTHLFVPAKLVEFEYRHRVSGLCHSQILFRGVSCDSCV